MPEPTNPRPARQNYQRVEGRAQGLAPGTCLVRAVDPGQILPVVIRVAAGAGHAGLDGVEAFARGQGLGLGLAETNADERSVVVWHNGCPDEPVLSGHLSRKQRRSERVR